MGRMITVEPQLGIAHAALSRFVRIDRGEVAASLWSFACFFFVLCGYYVLRPLRDEMGVQGGVENLPWLFSATFAAMLAAAPLFGWAAARLPRRRLVPWTYLFFIANVLVFYALFAGRVPVRLSFRRRQLRRARGPDAHRIARCAVRDGKFAAGVLRLICRPKRR